MDRELTEKILRESPFKVDDPLFHSRIFALLSKEERLHSSLSPLTRFLIDDFDEISRRLDRADMQESCAVRNILRARRLAELLINEKGEIKLNLLKSCLEEFKTHLYSIGPGREDDPVRQEHLLKALQLLSEKKELQLLIKKISRPLSDPRCEEMIRSSLILPEGTVLTDAHTRRAVLAAWFSYLRQNVGSCFATAPAQMIHDEQPENLLQDLLDLLSTGRLKRVFDGIERSVPLSPSSGSGDLKKIIKIHATEKGMTPEIWYSPGLIEAFSGIALLVGDLKQKIESLRAILEPYILSRLANHALFFTSPEEIITYFIMQKLEVSEKELKEEREGYRSQIYLPTLVVYPTQQGKSREKLNRFHRLLQTAKMIFKNLSENALLKVWEYTVASFSETKFEFAEWNLYSSLGMKTDEKGGIGYCIYQVIQSKLDRVNQEAQEKQYEYEGLFSQVKMLESRMRHTSTEQELQWVKMEYQNRSHELYSLQEQYQELKGRSESLVNLYETLYKLYKALFKDYFQEVYDPDMQEVKTGPYDDTPAGFRLLYKHGRSQTSQWTLIKDQNDFIEALASFFSSTESQILHQLEKEKIERDLSEVVTAIVTHVKTKEFLETAFHRMAIAHQTPLVPDPLNHLDQIQKKPWAYVFGGKMTTLISCYYKFDRLPTQVEKWVENEMELLVFISDNLKAIPPKLLEPYKSGRRASLLMESPTHAFRLLPLLEPFSKCWQNDEFTYTYIRDALIRPREIFIEGLLLNNEMIQFITEQLAQKIPHSYRPRFQLLTRTLHGPLNPIFFRDYVTEILLSDKSLQEATKRLSFVDEIDRLLYGSLPLVMDHEIPNALKRLAAALPGIDQGIVDRMMELYEDSQLRTKYRVICATRLQSLCKTLLHLATGRSFFEVNYHQEIARAAQKLGLALPAPLLFADTNWMKDYFGFVVSPGTGQLELWRLNKIGTEGSPMSSWKEWVNGSRPDLKWNIYVRPYEYGQI